VIRTPEPLVRTRKEPQNYEPPGQPRLQREVISLVDKPYLEVVAMAGVAGAAPLHIVSQPGLNLVIAAVDAGRNKPIAFSLRVHENQFLGEGSGTSDIDLLKMTLDAAIWEVA
jgi:large repetitive protein